MKLLAVVLLLGLALTGCSCSSRDWSTASRESAGVAPDPATTQEAVLQVFGARAWGWRGWFAIHTWIAAKGTGEAEYTVYDVVGWRVRRGGSALRIVKDLPDRYWYGARPSIIKEHRGRKAEELIGAVDAAARAYPWKRKYRAFPGPNSNTFTAWVGQQVPALELDLPFRAVGKGYVE